MIIETFVAGGLWTLALLALGKETQRRQGSLDRAAAGKKATLDAERISRKRQTRCRDTGGKIFLGAINNQTIGGIDLVQEIFEGVRLQAVEKFPSIIRQFVHCRHDAKRRVLYASRTVPRVSERRAVATRS